MTDACMSRLALISRRSGRTLEDVLEMWEERAAIREYDGGMRRREAERAAEDDVANEVLTTHATVPVAPHDGAGAS